MQCITAKLLDQEDILLILMGLIGSTRQIHARKETKDLYVENKGEGLHQECSTKDKKEWIIGCMAKIMIAISYGRGVIEYFRSLSGTGFPIFLNKGNNQKGKLFLQDEDPSHNCKISQEAMNKTPYRLFMMPPWSPDLNPIENIFHLIGVFLRKDAIMKKIKIETYKQFCNRVLTHFLTLHQIL